METKNKKVVETTDTEVKKSLDTRILYRITKPYKFHGEDALRSEIIELTPLSDKTILKTFSRYPKTDDPPRRKKTVRVDDVKLPNHNGMSSVTAYFDYLLANEGYSVAVK